MKIINRTITKINKSHHILTKPTRPNKEGTTTKGLTYPLISQRITNPFNKHISRKVNNLMSQKTKDKPSIRKTIIIKDQRSTESSNSKNKEEKINNKQKNKQIQNYTTPSTSKKTKIFRWINTNESKRCALVTFGSTKARIDDSTTSIMIGSSLIYWYEPKKKQNNINDQQQK